MDVTLKKAVDELTRNKVYPPHLIAEALRIPLVIAQSVMNGSAPKAWLCANIKDFQVSPLDASGLDPNMVGYIDQQFRLLEKVLTIRGDTAAAVVNKEIAVLKSDLRQSLTPLLRLLSVDGDETEAEDV